MLPYADSPAVPLVPGTAVYRALLRVFSAGLQINARSELEELLLALRGSNAEDSTVDLCEIRMCIAAKDWMGALRLLRQIEDSGRTTAVFAALQAWCLHTLHDNEWRLHAGKVLQSGDMSAASIIGCFLSSRERAELDIAA